MKDILVVDDEELICWSIRKELNKEGYNTECALNGKEALEKLEQNPFKVLITDIKLPDISGFKVIEAARTLSEDTRIIAMSSYRYEGKELDILKKYSCGFMAKPIDINVLNSLIKMNLSRESEFALKRGMGIRIIESTHDLIELMQEREIDLIEEEDKYSEEKRKHIRYRVLVDVVFSIDRHFVHSTALDLSREGTFIGTQITPDEGSAIDIDFFIPEMESAVSALGKVMRVTI